MARGRQTNSRGFRGGQFRGGNPRGSNPDRERGVRGRGRGRGRGGYIPSNATDFILQMWPQNDFQSGYSSPRGRGRGIGFGSPRGKSGTNTPTRGVSGYDSPRSRGRGRGRGGFNGGNRGGSKGKSDAPLSTLLAMERPLLKPIVFVPSTHTPFLFQQEEELIQPIVEEVGDEEQAHVPTADRVARVFSGNFKRPPESDGEIENSEGLEEIDFADMASFQQLVNDAATAQKSDRMQVDVVVEETFTGKFKSTPTPEAPLEPIEAQVDPASELPAVAGSTEPASVVDAMDEATMEPVVTSMSTSITEPGPIPGTETTITTITTTITATSNISSPAIPPPPALPPATEEVITEVSSTIESIDLKDSPQPKAEEKTLGFVIDPNPTPTPFVEPDTALATREVVPALGSPPVDEDIIVYVPPHPRSGRTSSTGTDRSGPSVEVKVEPAVLSNISILTGRPIGSTPVVPSAATPPNVDSLSFSFGLRDVSAPVPESDENAEGGTVTVDAERGAVSTEKLNGRHHKPPVFTANGHTPAKLKLRQRGQWAAKQRQRKSKQYSFASRGADVSEAQLYNWKKDPRMEERRRGDSDVDWGDEDEDEDDDGEEDEGEVRAVMKDGVMSYSVVVSSSSKRGAGASAGAEGMEVDPELELDVDAMSHFVEGMGQSGSRHVTMDDLEDERKMRVEDEEEDEGTSDEDEDEDKDEEDSEDDDEVDAIVEMEEDLLIAEPGDLIGPDNDEEDEEDDFDISDDDDEQSPKSSFQARLERLRQAAQRNDKGKDKGKQRALEDSSDDDDYNFHRNRTWAEDDDDFIAHIHDILDENDEILSGRDRAGKKKVFQAIYEGDFDDEEWKPAREKKDKYKDLPPNLAELWAQDRRKKAQRKQERELARLEAAADPLAKKKGGKKGRKAMLAAAKLDPTITVIPNRVIDMTTLVQQIRRFLQDIGGPTSMSLPPANKHTRKMVHELANAFNLKSQSKGHGDARYTTLTKTSRSGIGINERKIAKIVRRNGADAGHGGEFVGGSDVRKKYTQGKEGRMPKNREGDEVGKAAPKIDGTNIGFKMLASMGWSEGDRIGLSGGLANPLTAIIKHTKLGLGATRS